MRKIIVYTFVLTFAISFWNCTEKKEAIEEQKEPPKKEEAKVEYKPLIEYQVIREWKTGRGQVGMEVYVNPKSKKENVLELAKHFQEKYGSNLGVIKICKSKRLTDNSILLFILEDEIRDMGNW